MSILHALLLLSVSTAAAFSTGFTAPTRRTAVATRPRCYVVTCTAEPKDDADVAAWLEAGAAEAAAAEAKEASELKVPKDLEAMGRFVKGEGRKKPSMLELIFSPAAGQPEPGPKEVSLFGLFGRRKRAEDEAGD